MTYDQWGQTPKERALVSSWSKRLSKLGHLYRYLGLRGERFAWLENVLLRSVLYFPRYAELNDPFDGAVELDYRGSPERIRTFWGPAWHAEHGVPFDASAQAKVEGFVRGRDDPSVHARMRAILKEENDKMGVACFSEVARDIPMWAYYADGHQGACLRFRAPLLLGWNDCTPPLRVTYARRYPEVRWYYDSAFARFRATLATKARAWRHEREWRMVRRSGPASIQFNPGALDGVILGCRMSDEDKARLQDVLRRRAAPTEVMRACTADRKFGLTISAA